MSDLNQSPLNRDQAAKREVNPNPAPQIKLNDVVRLKKPYYPAGRGRLRLEVGIVVEVLGNGSLFGIKFNNYPNVCDFGLSLIAGVIEDPLSN